MAAKNAKDAKGPQTLASLAFFAAHHLSGKRAANGSPSTRSAFTTNDTVW